MKPDDTIGVLLCVHSQDDEHDRMFARALESLARQTRDPDEVIIIADECWEYTADQAAGYRDIFDAFHVFERPRKRGLAFAKNAGIEKCSGDWIAYLDADDMWMDCKLEIQREYMLKHPEIDFCGTESWDLDPDTGVLRPNCFGVGQYCTHMEITQRLSQENIMCHGSMMVRCTALDALEGPYRTDSSVHGREDWDLWLRASQAGFVFGKVPERLYVWSAGTSVVRGEVS